MPTRKRDKRDKKGQIKLQARNNEDEENGKKHTKRDKTPFDRNARDYVGG